LTIAIDRGDELRKGVASENPIHDSRSAANQNMIAA
jgi:hypothetical protein